ncbi:LPS export ABC transporter periplasmic protein LptC [Marinobacter sp. M216]|uniref:Lipopolysaccharide export system protein LptC n=1 Tax=Marinobacter albus TaxID=3030833 RepID=A0ABT7HA04_9GAMM|nr:MULTISPECIES: LPS export ABC transporter periplasmic protein LptC [unclassified Marinobacter]MBW7470531.1 LPS export ABC transporter periplasmic protein LptC [Marinobacter sp. F4218]MDK9557201.1 LPS export ABC transporter periplasmic protein LptC [Marinobacter sp. M216]
MSDASPGENDITEIEDKSSLISVLTLEHRPWLRSLALGGTIAATVFLMWRSDEPPVVQDEAAELRGKAEPDGFVINGSYTSYDEEGNLKIQFTSPRIEQFEEGNIATMKAPRAKLFGEPQTTPWIVEAENGSWLQNEGVLYLTDHVRVVRTIGEREATLTTTSLTLDNDLGTVYTDAPVTITDTIGVTRAKGMQAWINERILELNSQVEGRYETGK